jgi:hypothetical protein
VNEGGGGSTNGFGEVLKKSVRSELFEASSALFEGDE